MKNVTWGDICKLDYGKALRDCAEESSDENSFQVFGTNGPIGWTSQSLTQGPGVIVGRKGAYRGVHFSSAPFYVIDTAYYLQPTDPDLDLKWAYYKLLTLDMDCIDVGGAIPTTSRSAFYSLPVNVPRRTAQIVSGGVKMVENRRFENTDGFGGVSGPAGRMT